MTDILDRLRQFRAIMKELKPCPLCGSPAEIYTDEGDFAVINCKNWEGCGMELMHRVAPGRTDALRILSRRWNRRATVTVTGSNNG